ncbi:hypothetical protein ACWCXX_08805 [Streptomyces sp. NPDC001732]
MSAQEERSALTPRPSLYAYALRFRHGEPDGRLPEGGYELPPRLERSRGRTGWAEACAALEDVLTPWLTTPGGAGPGRAGTGRSGVGRDEADGHGTGPGDLAQIAEEIHRGLRELKLRAGHVHYVVAGLTIEDEVRARALGRCLVRTGTGPMAVRVGLALLARFGEPEDVPYLKVLGQLKDLVDSAVRALDDIDRPTAALVWLGHYAEGPELRRLVDALVAADEAAVRRCLVALPGNLRSRGTRTVRRIVEAVRLADVLRADRGPEGPPAAELSAGAGQLLLWASSAYDDRAEILRCPAAVDAYEAFVARAAELPPGIDHYALLLSVALELHSGPSRILDWEPGRREALLDALESVLNRPEWQAVVPDSDPEESQSISPDPDPDPESESESDSVLGSGPGLGSGSDLGAGPGSDLGPGPDSAVAKRRWRVRWIRRTARQPFRRVTGPEERLRIECTALDPGDRGGVETRILLDGRPVVPEVFDRGPANSPTQLLDSGLLRATDEPRKVQLAEAYCTEGCCGALCVTIRRDGEHVVWSDWSRPASRSSLPSPELPEYRFDAAAYDAEIARAENDHAWTTPSHRTARLIAVGLRDRPDLLTRWDARLHWIGAGFEDRARTTVSLLYRTEPATGQSREDESWRQRMWYVPEDGTSPEERAAAALQRLAAEDPRTYG